MVGGGAAGYFSAVIAKAKAPSMDVLILESSSRTLGKVRISGGGRCNVTNVESDPVRLAGHYPAGHKELKGPFHRFNSMDMRDWLEGRGVELKVEPDGRVFPKSNSSETIINCLVSEADRVGVEVRTGCSVTSVAEGRGGGFHVTTAKEGDIESSHLLLATGSSRAGWGFAKDLGHTIVRPIPSLFTFKVPERGLRDLAGVSVQDTVCALRTARGKFEQRGPLLVTHWGVSGPAVLKLSAWAARELSESGYGATLLVDLCPGLDSDLELEILRMKKSKYKTPHLPLSLSGRIPRRLWAFLLGRRGIDAESRYSEVKDAALRGLARDCRKLELPVQGKGPFKEEFVTSGGVDLKEIDLKTMESKLVGGLYFAGEIVNVDGETGGFNFQNAWTGGFLSGSALAAGLH